MWVLSKVVSQERLKSGCWKRGQSPSGGALEAEPMSHASLHPRCLIHSRCPENEASVEGVEQGEMAMEYKWTGMIWVETDTLLSRMGRSQETVTGAKTPKNNCECTDWGANGKTYNKGVKSKSQTEGAMLKTWGTWVSTKYNTVI